MAAKIIYETSDTYHWKNLFESKCMLLGSHNLNPDEEIVVNIKGISQQEIINRKGKKQNVGILEFDGILPMVLNVTNCEILESMYTSSMQAWIGKPIQIYATECKDYGGGKTIGLRIRDKIPEVDITDFEFQLRDCESMEELQETFLAFPEYIKSVVTTIKDEMKENIANKKGEQSEL